MEHSTLHAVQLLGLLLAFGGPVLVLALVRPAASAIAGGVNGLACELAASAARWTQIGALASAGATVLDIGVQVAELDNTTILGGVDVWQAGRFATATTVGRLEVLRVLLLLATAGAAAWLRRRRDPARAAAAWFATATGAAAALTAASLVSHAAAQPHQRVLAIALQAGHLIAAGVWIGTLMQLLAARAAIEQVTASADVALAASVVRRFSPLALVGAGALIVSGVWDASRYLGSPGAVVTSAYGLTLVVKLSFLVPLFVAGFVNFRVVRPALLAPETAAEARARLGRMIELEVTAAVLVVAVAGILGSMSPPGAAGEGRLSHAEATALLVPDLPTTRIVDPATWTDNPSRDVDDLRYSEFMHNYSGLAVALLGIAWLLHASGSSLGIKIGRGWPLALIPFAVFVWIASDPEVWPLGRVSPWRALANPVVLEHRIGALLVVVLAWLGRRDDARDPIERPLGRSLPLLMIGGSLLLLGHGHSSVGTDVRLTTIINVQHVAIGGIGLFAGTIRWLELRRLFPTRVARLVWPALVIAIGLHMAFWYREVV